MAVEERIKSLGFAIRISIPVLGLVLALVLAAGTLFTAQARAEDGGRTLGDYRFVYQSDIPTPFIAPMFRNTTGISMAFDVDIPIIILDTTPPDTLLSLAGDLLYVVAEYEYQFLVHPRVALNFIFIGGTRVGTDAESMLTQGVTALVDAKFGSVIRLWNSENMLLSGDLGLGGFRNLRVDFAKFAEDVINGDIENASILSTNKGVQFTGGLRYAWAVNEWSGVLLAGTLGYANVKIYDDKMLYYLSGGWSCDLGQRSGPPLGLGFVLGVDKMETQYVSGGTASSLGLSAFYTGRDDLNLGIETMFHSLPLQDSDITIHPVTFRIAFQYFY